MACIFARSTRGEKEFADFSVNQRAAVALARYLQDPLVEFAGTVYTLTFRYALVVAGGGGGVVDSACCSITIEGVNVLSSRVLVCAMNKVD